MENQTFIEKNNNSRKSNDIQNQNEENEIFIDKKLLTFRNSKLKKSQVKFITKKSFNERMNTKKNLLIISFLMKEDGQKKNMRNFLKE